MAEDNKYDVIVIGAGHNGLVASGYLARSWPVCPSFGKTRPRSGALQRPDEFAPGFLGPMCSYGLHGLRGKIIDDLRLREHGLSIARRTGGMLLRPGLHPFPDGSHLGGPGINSQLDAAEQIRQFSDSDARRYFDWVSFWEQAGTIFMPYFLSDPPSLAEVFDSVRGTAQEEVMEKVVTWSSHGAPGRSLRR